MDEDRVPTGIEGFDSLIEGGFPRGSLVLVAGNAGSGKTIFSAQYLYHGLSKLDESGVYVSFSENRETFLKNMRRLNMDFERYEREGRFKIMDFVTVKEKGVPDTLKSMLAEASSLKAKRMVIDSFSALAVAFSEKVDVRMVLHTVLERLARLSGVTTLMVSEKPIGFESQSVGMEEFVADGVIVLNAYPEGGYLKRSLQVIKMRGSKVDSLQHNYDIGRHGFKLYPVPVVTPVEKAFTDKVNMGIEGFEKMLNGGVFKGSQTMVVGTSGTGKTTSALHFILEGARRGERGLYVSSEEPVQQLIRCGEGFGWSMNELVDNGMIRVACYSFEPFNVDEHLRHIRGLIQEQKPVRFVFDSVTPLERAIPNGKYSQYMKSLVSYLKAEGVTALFTAISEATSSAATGSGFSTLMDNVISLRDVELGSSLKRSLVISKAKGMAHDRTIMEFEITPKGIKIVAPFSEYEGVTTGFPRRKASDLAESVLAELQKGRGSSN